MKQRTCPECGGWMGAHHQNCPEMPEPENPDEMLPAVDPEPREPDFPDEGYYYLPLR